RAGHRAYVAQLGVADLKAPAAHGTDQVVVRPVRHDGHEVQAHRLLRPDVVEEHLVMAVRADARRDLTLIFRTACPETEDHHHAAIEAGAPGAAVHPWQVRTGAVTGHWSAWPALSQAGHPRDATPRTDDLTCALPGDIVRPGPAAERGLP